MAIALRAALVDNADWIVWHDPQVLEPRPDFVVWSPTFGLLVLEVKAYTAPYVLQTDPHTWLVAGGRERRLNPARQARQAKYAVMDRLKRHPALCLPNPAREGELAFPVNHGVVFPNMSRHGAAAEAWRDMLGLGCTVLWQEDVTQSFAQRAVRESFVADLQHQRRHRGTQRLSPDAVPALRDVLFPVRRIVAVQVPPAAVPRTVIGIATADVLRTRAVTSRERVTIRHRFRTARTSAVAYLGRRLRRLGLRAGVAGAVLLALGLALAWRRAVPRARPAVIVAGPVLSVTPSHLHAGQHAILRWSAPNALRVLLDGKPVAAAGRRTIAPTATTTHVLVVSTATGTVVTQAQVVLGSASAGRRSVHGSTP